MGNGLGATVLLAIILALVIWSHPAPTVWVCSGGRTPTLQTSNCERLHFAVLGKWRVG